MVEYRADNKVTTEIQPRNRETLVSKIAGVTVGAGATLASIYNPSLAPYIAAGTIGATAVGVATLAGATDTAGMGMLGTIAGGASAALGSGTIGDALIASFGGSVVAVCTVAALDHRDLLSHKESTPTLIRTFIAYGFLTAVLLARGYVAGRTQSDITDVISQTQGLEIKQADGRTTPFTRQTDGTYLLEQRVNK